MRRLFAITVVVVAACAASADAGDAPVPTTLLTPVAVDCVPSADATAWMPSPGESLRLTAARGYGKGCDERQDRRQDNDRRWIAELVNGQGAGFTVQAEATDSAHAKIALTVYGWVPPRWVRRVYEDGHWQVLAEAEGAGWAAAHVEPSDDVVPYAMVRVAARAGDDGRALAMLVSR
jgi:hypothetical protein